MLASGVHKITPLSTYQIFVTDLYTPISITEDSNGIMYVIDSFGDTRKITQQGVNTVYVGNSANQGYADGTGTAAIFHNPTAATCDTFGNVYIADSGNAKIRKVDTGAGVTTLSNFFQVGVREMAVNTDGSLIYAMTSNSGDSSTSSNITFYSGGSNRGRISLTGLTYPEDAFAKTVTYNQNGNVYYSHTNTGGSGPKVYRIGTPSLTSNTTTLANIYVPVVVNVNNYPGSNAYVTYTQFSNIYLAAGTLLMFANFGGNWTGVNGRIFEVGFSNYTSDPYPLAGTFINIVDQLYQTGTVGMTVNVRSVSGSNVDTTLISNSWNGASAFIAGYNMNFYFSNSLAAIVGGGTVTMTGLTGYFFPYNNIALPFTDCNSPESPYRYVTQIPMPTGAVGKSCTMTTYTCSASVTGVSGIPAIMSNLFSPAENVLTGMSSGYLQKYTLSGDTATQVYSCNVGLYNGIGGVPNLASTLIPEVYTLDSSGGRILAIRNTY